MDFRQLDPDGVGLGHFAVYDARRPACRVFGHPQRNGVSLVRIVEIHEIGSRQ
jgi:hypothetical protein